VGDDALAARLGGAGRQVAAAISWEGVVERLVGAAVGAAEEPA
jgi:hypothetical protein